MIQVFYKTYQLKKCLFDNFSYASVYGGQPHYDHHIIAIDQPLNLFYFI